MILPPINTSGSFIFDTPFDTLLDSTAEYKVISIRSLTEMYNSGEDPCNTLYKAIGLTEDEYKEDLDTNVPIVVLSTTGGDYIYVPADRIKSMPNITGIKYRGSILAVDLKLLPLDYNYDVVKDVIINSVYDTIGVRSTVEIIPSTQITLLTVEEDAVNTRLRTNSASVTKSYKTRYEELHELFNTQSTLLINLEQAAINSCIANGTIKTDIPNTDPILNIGPGEVKTITSFNGLTSITISGTSPENTGILRWIGAEETVVFDYLDMITVDNLVLTSQLFEAGNWRSFTELLGNVLTING